MPDAMVELLRQIETQLSWGNSQDWTGRDFQELSERILQSTGERLSITTLKRVWGRIQSTTSPSDATLDILSRFGGYANWRAFRRTLEPVEAAAVVPDIPQSPKRQYRAWGIGLIVLALLIILGWTQRWGSTPAAEEAVILSDSVTFELEKVTIGIPNTVIFRYDIGDIEYTTLELQQTWDERKRIPLDQSSGLATTTYFYPGYFKAKLVIDGVIVKEQLLYLPSDGWRAIVADPDLDMPLYLDVESTEEAVSLSKPEQDFLLKRKKPYLLSLMKVMEEPQIKSQAFNFTTRFRLVAPAPESTCHFGQLLIRAEHDLYILHFSIPGCVGRLSAYIPEDNVSGVRHDLSGFGYVPNQWYDLEIRKLPQEFQLMINGEQAFTYPCKEDIGRIGGVQFRFEGLLELGPTVLRDADTNLLF